MKNKILELLYSWTVGLPEEVKIAEAYQMLKKQGEVPGRRRERLPPPGASLRQLQGLLAARSRVCPLTSPEQAGRASLGSAPSWLGVEEVGLIQPPLRERSPRSGLGL